MKNLLTVMRLLLACWRSWRIRRVFERNGARVGARTAFAGSCSGFGRTVIGEDCLINDSHLDGRGGLTIGSHCVIDQAVLLSAQHNLDSPLYETTYHHTQVGDYVIVYRGATILPGRRIGRGAIVAAGAVVAHDIPEMAIVAGNPARVVRQRGAVHSGIQVSDAFGVSLAKVRRQIASRLQGDSQPSKLPEFDPPLRGPAL